MNRLDKFVDIMRNMRLDGFLFMFNTDIHYLTGFTGSACYMWVSPERRIFMTDFRYESQAKLEVGEKAEIQITTLEKNYYDLLDELNVFQNVKYVGFDSNHTNYAIYKRVANRFNKVNWIPVLKPLENLREVVDTEELNNIKRAAEIAIKSIKETLPMLKSGIAEKDFAVELEYRIMKNGGQEKSFPIIVASGHRAALPHGTASDKIIKKGEMITIDFGAYYNYYASDITRTYFLGEPSFKFETIYKTVLNAQKTAIEGMKVGMKGMEIDALAREVIKDAGYEEFFGHGLGHGLGLMVHDYPILSSRTERIIPSGVAVTVEPGIYIPDWGGVRIEDDVLLTDYGIEVLTQGLPKEFEEIIIPCN